MAHKDDQHLDEARDFTLGRIVATKPEKLFGGGKEYGHVMGFGLNRKNEIVIVVQFPTINLGEYIIRSFHPTNLTIIR